MPSWRGFTGAGALVHDLSTDEFILIKDYHGRYSDMGGALQPPLSDGAIARTAAQELREESRKVFSFRASQLGRCAHVDLAHAGGKYRMYVVPLAHARGACTRYYRTDPSRLPRAYRETTGMTRFPAAQFRGRRMGATARTDTGRREKLDDRVRAGLAKALKAGYV